MKNLGTYGSIMALSSGGLVSNDKRLKTPTLKQCLNCGKGHEHNNYFCSAECSKKYGYDPLIEEENTKTQNKNMVITGQ